jgi:proteasome lid subunit RPN8/RPN11
MHIQLKREHIEIIRNTSANNFPLEACGILVGYITPKKIIATRIVCAINKSRSTTRFQIDPEFLLETINKTEKEGLELVGFFHSHPNNIQPSSIDEIYMKFWPGVAWVIWLAKKEKIGAYLYTDSKILEIPIVVK